MSAINFNTTHHHTHTNVYPPAKDPKVEKTDAYVAGAILISLIGAFTYLGKRFMDSQDKLVDDEN